MKIILFSNTIESQEFFSFQLDKKFRSLGHETFFYNCYDELDSFSRLQKFIEPGNTVTFSFNFHGLMDDGFLCSGREPVFWDDSGIPFVNMVIDHPYYYHRFFRHVPQKYTQICIDINHIRYMKRFFPEIRCDDYIELGGTSILDTVPRIPYKERKYDLIFTGNYTNPDTFEKFYADMDEPVRNFYHELRDRLIEDSESTVEDMAEKMIRAEFGDKVTDAYLRECNANLIACDLQVRHYFREKAVTRLADAGFKISTFGGGYENAPCRHPENIKQNGIVSSQACLDAIAQSKVVLNVMPWFKDGAHDRVFNTMLNGAISLSDHSKALDREFINMENIAFYNLKNIDGIVDVYQKLIDDPDLAESIAEAGYQEALMHHSWSSRAVEIEQILKRVLKEEAGQ